MLQATMLVNLFASFSCFLSVLLFVAITCIVIIILALFLNVLSFIWLISSIFEILTC